VLELESWHGFALATRRALELVRTPLVCVLQHDLAFLRKAELRPVAHALLHPTDGGRRRVRYVHFPRATQHGYRHELRMRTRLQVGPPVEFAAPGGGSAALTRFPQFLDGTHLACTEWYLGMFERAEREPPFLRMARRGATQENTLGEYMLALAKRSPPPPPPPPPADGEPPAAAAEEGGSAAVSLGVQRVVAEFGGWLWNVEDPQGFLVFHLDSGRHYAQWERDEKGLPPSPMLENYRKACAAQAAGAPVEAILPLVPQTTGKRVLAATGLCQARAPET
jgi:hypothetical protein